MIQQPAPALEAIVQMPVKALAVDVGQLPVNVGNQLCILQMIAS
jgi:hypothetical protein